MPVTFDPGLNAIDHLNRRGLVAAGLAEETVDSPAGPQTYFAGGSGRTLCLLHGAGDHAGGWVRVAAPLIAAGYRVVIPDLAGHGASAPHQGSLPMEVFLAGLGAVVAHAVEPPAVLVGNSFGAWLAILWALRHPAGVERVVAVDGGPIAGLRSDLTLTPTDRDEARRVWQATVSPSHWAAPDALLDELIRKGRDGALARISIAAMREHLMDGRLGEISTPIDLLWGESDRLVPLEYARTLAAGLPNARLTRLAGCGHMPQLECADRFASALLGLLAGPPPRGPLP